MKFACSKRCSKAYKKFKLAMRNDLQTETHQVANKKYERYLCHRANLGFITRVVWNFGSLALGQSSYNQAQ